MFSNNSILSKCGKKICNGNENDCPGTSGEQLRSETRSNRRLSIAAFRSRKGEERAKHFKPCAAKKAEKEVRINSGIVTKKDGNLSVKRGVTLPVSSQ